MLNLILIIILSYLLGAIPTAYLLIKIITGKDIRHFGSKNVGAMNAHRVLKEFKNKQAALFGFLLVLFIDLAKGAAAVFLSQAMAYGSMTSLFLAGFFVILGHNHSVFLKFTGGKGAASLMGIFLYLDPVAILVWGAPIIFASLIAQYFLFKKGKVEKIGFKISQMLELLKTQMVGRYIGLIAGPLCLYFYSPFVFYATSGGIILLLIKNYPRLRAYLKIIS